MISEIKYTLSLSGIACFTFIMLISCERNLSSPFHQDQPASFSEIFESFWNKMNTHYVYWDIDTTNWNKIYYQYKPLFEKLDLKNNEDVRTSVTYFKGMTSGLIDAHYTIQFLAPPIKNTFISPALSRKKAQDDFYSPFPYTEIDKSYLDPGYLSGSFATSDSGRLTVLCGTIHNHILYFHCNRFTLKEAHQAEGNNSAKIAIQYFFNQLNHQHAGIEGIIIDVRNNPGGSISDLSFFMGHLIESPLHFGYTRYKDGNGRLAYTPWIDAIIEPYPGCKAITNRVIALADNYTVSLAEAVTMVVHSLPSGMVVGERTWGATGPVTSEQVYNDGPFTIPGFLSVTTSSAEFKFINDIVYEGRGFPPDVVVPFDLSAWNTGKDVQLEKAIALLP